MIELKNGESVSLTNGSQAKVVKELGRGGQGIVYLVEVGGQKMALKWYFNNMGNWFYSNLEENISKGACPLRGSIPMARVPNNETKRNLWLRDEIKAKRLL